MPAPIFPRPMNPTSIGPMCHAARGDGRGSASGAGPGPWSRRPGPTRDAQDCPQLAVQELIVFLHAANEVAAVSVQDVAHERSAATAL